MNTNRLSFALILTVLLGGEAVEAQSSWLHSSVLDMHGAVIPGVQIRVASGKQECLATTDVEGKFNCQLPSGGYEVTARGSNIIPYRRSRITLVAAQHTFLIVPCFRRTI